LIALTTMINSAGVRLLALINNFGVIAELVGVAFLIGLLAANIRRGPAVLCAARGGADGTPLCVLGPFLAAALMPSYVMYGFDTAGALAEETDEPRRRAPWAIVQALIAAGLGGGLLILFGILAVSDPARPELGQLSGGLPFLVKNVLGPGLGTFLLVEVVFAIVVCALAVQAGSVRLVFAMARDNSLPFAHRLAHVTPRTHAPIVPSIVIGLLAATILVLNINMPHVVETLCAVAIVWANLAYLMVTFLLLIARLRPRRRRERFGQVHPNIRNREIFQGEPRRRLFSLGKFGLPINIAAVLWGSFVVINVGWPRPEIYGTGQWGQFAAPVATLILIASGSVYFLVLQRKGPGVLREHAVESVLDLLPADTTDRPIETGWNVQLATGD
jgi:amino acid transporter